MRGRVIIGACAMGALALAAMAAPPPPGTPVAVKVSRPGTQYFSLAFDRPMDTSGSVPQGAVRTTPARDVRCYWDEYRPVLDCELTLVPLPRASRIRVQVGAGLRTADGRAVPPVEVAFDTDPPSLVATAVGWRHGTPTIELTSDLPLRAGTLDGKVTLRSRDGTWPVTLVPRGLSIAGGSRFAVAWPDGVPGDTPLQLTVDGPFLALEGDLPGRVDGALMTLRAGATPTLASAECVPGSTGDVARRDAGRSPDAGGGARLVCHEADVVRLRWTARLDDASRTRIVRGIPAGAQVRFTDTAVPAGPGEVGMPGTELTVVGLPAGASLRWRAGDVLSAVDGRAIVMRDIDIAVQSPPASVVLPTVAVPANARARVLPRVGDARAFSAGWVGFDGTPRGGRIAVPDSHGTTRRVTSREVERVLARGGWVEWNLPLQGPMRAVSWAPPFDVRVVSLPHSVAVWATPWGDDDAVAGARVQVFRITPEDGARVVATGQTDAHGVAVLAVPRGERSGERVRWGVQVHHRGRTASQLLDLHAGPGSPHAPSAGQWLLTDRLVYRPGDTVYFAGWRRLREGVDGRVPDADTTTLEFKRSYQGRRTVEVPAQWDQDGGTSGQFVLPADLESGDYCLRENTRHAVCLRVEQDLSRTLWLDVARDPGVDALTFTLQAGTWHGVAPDPSLQWSGHAFLDARSPADVHPEWAGYTFLPIARPDVLNLPLEWTLGRDGHARARVRTDLGAPLPVPLSGTLTVSGTLWLVEPDFISVDRREVPWAPSASTRYVGMRLVPGADATAPWRAETVVIDAEGNALPGLDVVLEVQDADVAGSPVLARCTLASGVPGTCAWRSLVPGRYRVTARSGDAIAAEQVIPVAMATRPAEAAPDQATWSWRTRPAAPGDAATIVIHHAFAEADAFAVAMRADGALVARAARLPADGALVLPAVDGDTVLDQAAWWILVRERVAGAGDAPPRMQTLWLKVPKPTVAPPSPLRVAFDAAGRTLEVRNTADAPITAVVSVIDEVSAVVAPWQWLDRDPAFWRARAAFDDLLFGGDAPSVSTPHGHGLNIDHYEDGATSDCAAHALEKALASAAFNAPRAFACAANGAGEGPFWTETNRAEGDPFSIHVADFPPIWDEYFEPVALDHAWPAGAPRGGDGHARFRAVLWAPMVTLQPGETRTFALPAPTHPVHWVARAWTVVAPGVVTASDAHVAIEAVLTANTTTGK